MAAGMSYAGALATLQAIQGAGQNGRTENLTLRPMPKIVSDGNQEFIVVQNSLGVTSLVPLNPSGAPKPPAIVKPPLETPMPTQRALNGFRSVHSVSQPAALAMQQDRAPGSPSHTCSSGSEDSGSVQTVEHLGQSDSLQSVNNRQLVQQPETHRLRLEHTFVQGTENRFQELLQDFYLQLFQSPDVLQQKASLLQSVKSINKLRGQGPGGAMDFGITLIDSCTQMRADPFWAGYKEQTMDSLAIVQGSGNGREQQLPFRYGKLAGKVINIKDFVRLPNASSVLDPEKLGYPQIMQELQYQSEAVADEQQRQQLQLRVKDVSKELRVLVMMLTLTHVEDLAQQTGNFSIPPDTWLGFARDIQMTADQIKRCKDVQEFTDYETEELVTARACMSDLLDDILLECRANGRWSAGHNLNIFDTVAALQGNEMKEQTNAARAAMIWMFDILTSQQMDMLKQAFQSVFGRTPTYADLNLLGHSCLSATYDPSWYGGQQSGEAEPHDQDLDFDNALDLVVELEN